MKQFTLSITLIFTTLFAQAQLPNVIPYQGNIADTSGDGYHGAYNFSFRILNAASTELWSSGTLSLNVQKGNYSIDLGAAGQTAMPADIWTNDQLFLEITFNDGVNGVETLSPNVRILPVPYAMRAGYADKSSGTGFEPGDSLILRDKDGFARFVFNPNKGEFRMMSNDTTWLSMRSNSNVIVHEDLPGGGWISRYWEDGPNGEKFITTQIAAPDNGPITFNKEIHTPPSSGKAFYIVQDYKRYCTGDISILEYRKTIYKYLKDVNEAGLVKKAGIHVYEFWNDCKTGLYLKSRLQTPTFDSKAWEDEQNAMIEEIKNAKYKVTFTAGGTDSFEMTVNPKDGTVEHSKEWARYVVGIENGKTVEVDYNDSSKTQTKTTRDPTNATTTIEGQDNYVWVPEAKQQCFSVAFGADSIQWYASNLGMDYNFPITVDGLTTPKFELKFDTTSKLGFHADSTGWVWQSTYGNANNVLEITKPDEATIEYQGLSGLTFIEPKGENYANLLVDSKGTTWKSGSLKTGNSLGFGAGVDNNNFLWTTRWSTVYQTHKKDSTVTIEFRIDSTNLKPGYRYEVNIPDGYLRQYNDEGWNGMSNEPWSFITTAHDSNSKKTFKNTINFRDSSQKLEGVNSTGIEIGQHQAGYELDNGTGWFGTNNTNSGHSVGFGTLTLDSTFTLYGGKRYQVIVPDNLFQSYWSNGSTAFGNDLNFKTKDNLTWGFSTHTYAFPSQYLFQIGSNSNAIETVAIGPSNKVVGFQYQPVQGIIVAQSNSSNATFVADHLLANKTGTVKDSLFVGKYVGVNGVVQIQGNLNVSGNISKGGGTFRIDHPDDPYNKYLNHSFIESPDMMNVYNGNVTTDTNGIATIQLPDYFESLNMDFRYQLTVIGTFAQTYVLNEIQRNSFTIKTDKPNVKVSWQVTGIRKDDYANENRVVVEVDKEPDMKGKRLFTPKSTQK